MKITEFQTDLQQIGHDFVTEMQKRDNLAEREVMFDRYDWIEEFMKWMIAHHRHVDDPNRQARNAGTLGPSPDMATGDRMPLRKLSK